MVDGTAGPALGIDAFRLVARSRGRFGELLLCDDADCRSLWCDAQCQGSLYLDPPATIGGPGPVGEAAYLLGWLLALAGCPRACVLMGGLGCGAGVLTILHHFPDCRLTVAEIDPEVIALTRAHVPLVAAYEATGQLTLRSAAIETAAAEGAWDVALLDCFQDSSVAHCPDALLADLRATCGAVWLNVVDDERGTRAQRWQRRFAAAGWPVEVLLPMPQVDDDVAYFSGNVVVGTAALDRTAVAALTPFADLQGASVRAVQAAWQLALAAPMLPLSADAG